MKFGNHFWRSVVTAAILWGIVSSFPLDGVRGEESSSPEPVRTWRLANGDRYEAVWIRREGDSSETIRFQSDGKIFETDFFSLSPEDQNYIRVQRGEVKTQTGKSREKQELTVTLVDDLSTPGTVPGQRRTIIVNGIEFGFCWCPPGTFMMGSPEDEPDRENFETEHEVTLTRGFWLLESEVTQRFWESVMNRSQLEEFLQEEIDELPTDEETYEGGEYRKLRQLGLGDDYPVYYVSWDTANEFCRKLSEKAGIRFTLPTEAQWEYACRAGTTGPFAVKRLESSYQDAEGNSVTVLSMEDPSEMGWTMKNSQTGIHPVKSLHPNAWGLYDMHGNLWEMCSDIYSKDYYEISPSTDPVGPEVGTYRVNRGGSWCSYEKFCRSACRYRNAPTYRFKNLGFRILTVPNPSDPQKTARYQTVPMN